MENKLLEEIADYLIHISWTELTRAEDKIARLLIDAGYLRVIEDESGENIIVKA